MSDVGGFDDLFVEAMIEGADERINPRSSVTFARLCEHRKFKPHPVYGPRSSEPIETCPGGVVLDPERLVQVIAQTLADNDFGHDCNSQHHMVVALIVVDALDALAAAQTGEVTA